MTKEKENKYDKDNNNLNINKNHTKNKNKTKCQFISCGKKITFTNILTNTCKCKLVFCNEHRLPELHECSYDYLDNVDSNKFIKENKCIASKLNKI